VDATIQHYIDGQLVEGRSDRDAPIFNPATGEVTSHVPLASAEEVNQAVAAANAAFPRWAMTTPLRRARVLNRFLRLLCGSACNFDPFRGVIGVQN
jgi:malonate-semialdehyde dehydrogenase (acetylating) / methylmalonate-semialdehyde dehydrogenase